MAACLCDCVGDFLEGWVVERVSCGDNFSVDNLELPVDFVEGFIVFYKHRARSARIGSARDVVPRKRPRVSGRAIAHGLPCASMILRFSTHERSEVRSASRLKTHA